MGKCARKLGSEIVNAHWARGRLLSFRELLSYEGYTDEFGEPAYRLLARDDDVIRSAHIAEQIMDRVVPSWRSVASTPSIHDLPWAVHRVWVERAIAQLEAEEELAENMGPRDQSSLPERCISGSGTALRRCGRAVT